MKKILCIGGYFPEISYETVNNYLVYNELAEKYKLYLLSDSWYQVSKKTYNFLGDMDGLSMNYPFENKYYIDPVQCKYSSNEVAALIGLACKVIEKHNIDAIFCTNICRYALVIDWIKMKYNIKNLCYFFHRDNYRFLFEDYSKQYAFQILKNIDKIYVSNCGIESFLPYELFEKKIERCSISKNNKIFDTQKPYILITGEIDGGLDKVNLEWIKTLKVNNIKLKQYIYNSIFNDIEYNKIDDFLKELIGCVAIMDIKQLISLEVENIDYSIGLMLYGSRVLVNKKSFEYIKSKYDVVYEQYDKFYLISSIKENEKLISDILL